MRNPLTRVRALPWALLLQAGIVVNHRWHALSEKERHRVVGLLRDSRGWPGNLTNKERDELRGLMRKLDLVGAGRDMLPLARGKRKRK